MDNTMKSVAFHNLGCKVNGYEMDYMQQNLQERGYIVVPFDTKADIYIINTCSVTNMADRKSRQMMLLQITGKKILSRSSRSTCAAVSRRGSPLQLKKRSLSRKEIS